jgi:hypothetical protein
MSTVLQLGSHKSTAIVMFLHILPFYTSNWEECPCENARSMWLSRLILHAQSIRFF